MNLRKRIETLEEGSNKRPQIFIWEDSDIDQLIAAHNQEHGTGQTREDFDITIFKWRS